mgnify:CR=1 FL=1|jgi:hypothetical protein
MFYFDEKKKNISTTEFILEEITRQFPGGGISSLCINECMKELNICDERKFDPSMIEDILKIYASVSVVMAARKTIVS